MINQIKKDKAETWRKMYEEGAAMDDISATESYKEGRLISTYAIRQAIVWAGGKIRTYSETVNMKLQKKFSK